MRINKYLSLCGIGSRRGVEKIIKDGRVSVNGRITRELATTIDTESDRVTVDGKPATPLTRHIHAIMYKPAGYLTTSHDDRGRPTVMDLLPDSLLRRGLFPVGRLDKNSEGLLLFTTDGDLAEKLMRPESRVEKVYEVGVNRPLQSKHLERMARGIYLRELEITTRPARIIPNDYYDDRCTIIIHEGKKRQIRVLFRAFGYNVRHLTRVAYGPLTLKGMEKGSVRRLKSSELKTLRAAISETPS